MQLLQLPFVDVLTLLAPCGTFRTSDQKWHVQFARARSSRPLSVLLSWFSLVLMLTSLEVSKFTSHKIQLAFQHQGVYRLCISRLQHAHNFESVSVSFARHRHLFAAIWLCEKTPVLIQRERESLCSELRSTQKVSSRFSCNHCGELNFDLLNEILTGTSPMGPRSCPFAPSALLLLFAAKALPTVPTHASASRERRLLYRTTRWSPPSPEFSLGKHLVLD